MRPVLRASIGVVSLLVSFVIPSAAQAVGATTINYAGTTSQGKRMSFTVAERDGRSFLVQFQLSAQVSCPDGKIETHDVYATTAPRSIEIVADHFEIPQREGDLGSDGITLAGTFTGDAASGTGSWVAARLADHTQAAQLCPSGDFTWTAALKGREESVVETHPPGAVITSSGGSTRTTGTVSEDLPDVEVTHYRGPTSQSKKGRPRVDIFTGLVHGRTRLLYWSYYARPITCPDESTTWLWSAQYWFRATGGPLVDDGALPLLGSNQGWTADRFSGAIAGDQASGTLTVVEASLTSDWQAAQLCTTGDVTWAAQTVDDKSTSQQEPSTGPGYRTVRH